MSRSGLSRRGLLGLSGLSLSLLARPGIGRAAAAPLFPDGVTILASGPDYGYVAGWAKLLIPHLLDGLPAGVTPSFTAMGGPDGVTVGNAFGARMDPDGSTLMFVPGAAMLAWLEGDSRVKYDPGQWIPILIGVTPAVLVARPGVSLIPGQHRPLRLGATNPLGPELAALLALDVIGVPAVPVYGMGDAQSLSDSLERQSIDLAFLTGPKIADALALAAAAGARPLFSTGAESCAGPAARDPQIPDVPSFAEAATAQGINLPGMPGFAAYSAAAAAAAGCFMAVLPDLVRAETVSVWRRGAEITTDSLSIAAVSVPQGLRFLTGACARSYFAQITGSSAMLAGLRATVQQRYGWHAS